jgi:hypothetical protein
MATDILNTPATFRNASDFRTLLVTLEELTVAALDESDDKRRASILWSMQKNIETAAKDIARLDPALG